ncbi:galactose-3-O-sulfotransferase 4 [Patella vulgata]|uniref:galactose-3-O-sulfotransferase 4 n=1 Tax=Patella vulgata TaxID=6465 RepID=UPI00217FEDCE|nr:galactose-3-O-sulfotransferase 4 [Patella vulgata]
MYLTRRKVFGLYGILALFAVVITLMIGGYNFNKPGSTNRTSTTKPTQCTKRTNIAFLKVHKCGSTTMSNILHRFALRYNLNVVLPDKNGTRFWVLGLLDKDTHKKIIPVAKGEEYNILAVDTYYNKHIYEQLIPNHPFFLAIFREPVERYISYLFYHKNTRETLIQKMKTNPYIFHGYTGGAPPILNDFSFYVQNLSLIRFTERMDNEFDMIMVTEYFDQSLILLKRKLCWTLRDIIYITSNKNLKNSGYAMSPVDRQNIINHFKNDSIFYEHFKSKLFKELSKLGAGFLEELHQFKMILKLVKDYCTFVKKGDTSLVIPKSSWNQRFIVDPYECFIMQLTEFPLVQILQKRQHKLYYERSKP